MVTRYIPLLVKQFNNLMHFASRDLAMQESRARYVLKYNDKYAWHQLVTMFATRNQVSQPFPLVSGLCTGCTCFLDPGREWTCTNIVPWSYERHIEVLLSKISEISTKNAFKWKPNQGLTGLKLSSCPTGYLKSQQPSSCTSWWHS